MGKIVGQTELFSFDMATHLEGKLNSNLLNSLKIDIVSHPAGAGVGKYVYVGQYLYW